jgi:hypothetical protein
MEPGLAIAPDELEDLEGLWEDRIRERYQIYLRPASPLDAPRRAQVALAAALVETALGLQRLGAGIAPAPELLLGDLCLARASRLLADMGDQRLQIGFARAVEEAAAAAATGRPLPAIRGRLIQAIEERT